MLTVKILCVGKLKEAYFYNACDEYLKRLSKYCRVEIVEIKEERLPDSPSEKQLNEALLEEEKRILEAIPKGSFLIALCVEGDQISSEDFARQINDWQVGGESKLCFLIGGSEGLSDNVKKQAGYRISLSKMTFPHHLARVVLLEQLYRAFQIVTNGKYHK
ncbi:MAG: 23S rRNA (pseudouridine(1915)-N(3))-methyltransferase RlmH [Clostridiales bacterium]|nr:23S rRNA (pseudouridine(1915)-N(3))-methyltransferase RlmH [Clostridiales bacterium]